MNKILLTILIIIFVLLAVGAGAYLNAGYLLNKYAGPEYLFVHPTIAELLNATPVCPDACSQTGVCGADGKNYCNKCIAFQHNAGYAHDGPCLITISYTNKEYGFSLEFTYSWKGYSVEKQTWEGHVINDYSKTYSGTLLVVKNPQTTSTQQWQDVPIMVFTPDVWKLVSGDNPTVAVSAAPIGPAKIGENSKYIFATPPRWYGFTDAIGFDEAVNIVKTFKAF